eukprot:SAG11_NODE_3886_length_2166_cov_2.698113_2_plen_91_part_01
MPVYGPFQIIEQLGPVSYRLKIPPNNKIHDIFHVALLKPASNFQPDGPVEQFPEPDGDEEYEVERILAKRENGGDPQYLVKWAGYLHEEST